MRQKQDTKVKELLKDGGQHYVSLLFEKQRLSNNAFERFLEKPWEFF